jgi:hypothetical protein
MKIKRCLGKWRNATPELDHEMTDPAIAKILRGRSAHRGHADVPMRRYLERKAWRASSPPAIQPMKSGFVFDGGSRQVRDIGGAFSWSPYFALVEIAKAVGRCSSVAGARRISWYTMRRRLGASHVFASRKLLALRGLLAALVTTQTPTPPTCTDVALTACARSSSR